MTRNLVLLDTDICSPCVKLGLQQNILLPPGPLAVSAMTRAELMFGLKRLPPENRLHLDVPDFPSRIPTFAWTQQAADLFAERRFNLRSSGLTIGDFDKMIAAHALALGATLVTNNLRHYRRVHLPLKLQNWAEE